MKRHLPKLRRSFLYYWVGLVIAPALWGALTSHDTKGELKNTIIEVLTSMLLAAFGVAGLGAAGVIKNVGLNVTSGLQVLGAYIVLRFMANVLYLPYKMYQQKAQEASKGTWENIDVVEHNIQDGDLRAAGLEIINRTQFNVILAPPIVEEAFEDRRHISKIGSKRFTLWWHRPDGQRFSSSSVRLHDTLCVAVADCVDGKAILYAVDIPEQIELKPGKSYHLRIRLRGEMDGCYLPLRDVTIIVRYSDGEIKIKKVKDEIKRFVPKERIGE